MDRNAEKNIKTEEQKPAFKFLSSDNIKLQRTYELFPYNVKYGLDDISLSSFFTAFSLTAGTGSYGSICAKFYDNQSITSDGSYAKIIPSSRAHNNLGSVSSNVVFAFLTNGLIHKDGISNLNKEKNVVMNFSCAVYNYSISSTMAWGLGDSRNINYTIYDKKISATSGYMIMRILTPEPDSILALSGSLSSDFIQYDDLAVGKIFYDDGLIVLDSFTQVQNSIWTLSGEILRYFAPYPTVNSSVDIAYSVSFNLTAGNIPFMRQDFAGVYFNRPTTAVPVPMYDADIYDGISYTESASLSGFYTSVNSPSKVIIVDSIEFNSKINKNSYVIEIPILRDDFNYSGNTLRVGNSNENIPEATEENPIWFNKVGLYDYKNNLIGVAKLSLPLKNTNKRTMLIKLKADY